MKKSILWFSFLSSKKFYYFIISLVCIIFFLQFMRYIHINLDDKFIIYKYSLNFLNGNGFSFNPGERVEGFSSFLYVIMMSLIFKIFNIIDSSLDSVIKMSILGRIVTLIFSFLSLIYLGKILKKIFKLNNLIIFATLLILSFRIDFVYHSTSGLETGVFIFLYIAYMYHLFYFMISDTHKGKLNYLFIAIFGSLVILTRVDGFIFIGATNIIYLIVFLFFIKPGFKNLLIHFLKLSIPFIIILFIFFMFRYLYFKDIFPNTYYVKVPNISDYVYPIALWYNGHNLVRAWESIPITFIYYVLPSSGFIYILAAFFIVFSIFIKIKKQKNIIVSEIYEYLFKAKNQKMTRFSILFISIILFIIFSLYTSYIGGDWMPGFRYVMHYYAFFHVIFISITLYIIFKLLKFDNKLFISYLSTSITFIIIFTVIININVKFNFNSKYFYEIGNNDPLPLNHSFYIFKERRSLKYFFTIYSDFAEELKNNLKNGDTIAIYEVGCIGLLLGDNYKIIDIGGLNDKNFAKLSSGEGIHTLCVAFLYINYGKIRGPRDKYLLKQDPKYIIFDTFAYIDPSQIPLKILDGRYKYINNFQNNKYNFFTIFKKDENINQKSKIGNIL